MLSTALLLLTLAAAEAPPDFLVGGCGGAWFLAPKGPLEVRVVKHDRNRNPAPAELRAILFGPDRQVVAEACLAPVGGPANQLGPAQEVTLRTEVPRPGVYGLNITVSNDRYGDNIAWGLSTNCPRWVVETARGHRDRRHEEPLLLLDRSRPGQVCFRPRRGAFGVALSGVPPQTEATLLDAAERP
ncbi:MAG: hypothetical protein HUU35_10025, partial [Armatimonadetes bacterium]|nr:hypothetical protein [Armatimonadota bacterium]